MVTYRDIRGEQVPEPPRPGWATPPSGYLAERLGREAAEQQPSRTARTETTTSVQVIPLGGARDIPLIEGLDGVVTSVRAVAQEMSNISRDLQIITDRQIQFLNQQASSTTAGTEGAYTQRGLTQALREGIQEQTQALINSLPRSNLPPEPQVEYPQATWLPGRDPEADDHPRETSPASSGTQTPLDQVRGGIPEGRPTQSLQEVYARNRDYLGGKSGFSLANVRKDIGDTGLKWLSNYEPKNQILIDPLGNARLPGGAEGEYGELATPEQIAAAEREKSWLGVARNTAFAVKGGSTITSAIMSSIPAGGGAAAAGGAAGVGGAAAGGGAVAGGGAMAALGSAAAVAGVVAALGYAVKEIRDWGIAQRQQNDEFNSQRGGGPMDAFEERARGQVFNFKNWLTMDGAQADRLYKSVSQMNMSEEDQGRALDFATGNYQDMSMSVDESVRIIEIASKRGQSSLLGVGRALREVTKSANEANLNVDDARKTFVKYWDTFSETIQAPGAAATAAMAVTRAQDTLGTEGQSIDFSQMADSTGIRMALVGTGMDYNEYVRQSMMPGGQNLLLELNSKRMDPYITRALGGEDGRAWVQNYIAANGGEAVFGDPTHPQYDTAMRGLQTALLERPDVMPVDVATQVLNNVPGGPRNLTQNNVLDYMVGMASGYADPVEAAKKEVEESKTRSWNPDEEGEGTVKSAAKNAVGWAASLVPDVVEGPLLMGAKALAGGERDSIERAFWSDASSTKRRGGLSEEIALGSPDHGGIEEVIVETSDGQRVVSLSEAMTHFRDQIDAGTAIVATGPDDVEGGDVATALNMQGDSSVEVTSSENEDLGGKGQSIEDFQKDKGTGGTVTISPSPQLASLLRFSSTGYGVDLDSSYYPPDPNVAPGSRPTGEAR